MRKKLFEISLILTAFVVFSSIINAATGDYTTSSTNDAEGVPVVGSIMVFITMLFSCMCYCIPIIFGLALTVLWIVMLVDLIQRDEEDLGPGTNMKMVWLLIVLLTSYVGAAIYYFMVYSKFTKKK